MKVEAIDELMHNIEIVKLFPMEPQMIHYTYWIVDHINHKYYHGVHSAKNEDAIKKYYSSSKILKKVIKEVGKEHFEKRIEKTFATRDAANAWEAKVHKRLNVAIHPKFYNAMNARVDFYTTPVGVALSERHYQQMFSPEARAKHSAKKKGRKPPFCPERIANISKAKKGKPLTEAHKNALRGVKKTMTEALRKQIHEIGILNLGRGYDHPTMKDLKPFIFTRISDSETFFVTSPVVFSNAFCNGKRLTKTRAVAEGRRSHTLGFYIRYATDSEINKYFELLKSQNIFFMKIDVD